MQAKLCATTHRHRSPAGHSVCLPGRRDASVAYGTRSTAVPSLVLTLWRLMIAAEAGSRTTTTGKAGVPTRKSARCMPALSSKEGAGELARAGAKSRRSYGIQQAKGLDPLLEGRPINCHSVPTGLSIDGDGHPLPRSHGRQQPWQRR